MTTEKNLKINVEELTAAFKKKNKENNNNRFALQAVDHLIDETEDENVKAYLQSMYNAAETMNEAALATMAKAIIRQKKVFFVTSQNSLKKAIDLDKDNKIKGSPKLDRLSALMTDYKIEMLWDAERTGAKRGAGFVIYDEQVLSYLNLSKEDLKDQFYDLQAFCNNDTIDDSLLFDDVGDMRVKRREIRKKILDLRKKKKDTRNETGDTSNIGVGSKSFKKNYGYIEEPISSITNNPANSQKSNESTISDDFSSSGSLKDKLFLLFDKNFERLQILNSQSSIDDFVMKSSSLIKADFDKIVDNVNVSEIEFDELVSEYLRKKDIKESTEHDFKTLFYELGTDADLF